jgi:glycosyltransferase involved in cell wall biosynthesis
MLDGMRIAALIPQGIVNSIYRSLVPMQALAQRGHTVHIEERDDVLDAAALREYDAVQLLRFFHPGAQRLVRRLRAAGIAVVWDNDDDFTHAEAGDKSLYIQRARAAVRTLVQSVDAVTTPSEVLADMYRRMGAEHVTVLGNQLPAIFRPSRRVTPHPGMTIGWLAMPGHETDYERLGLRDTFERLLNRHQHLEVISVGINLGLRSRRYIAYPALDYGELPDVIVHFDVGIAPLADEPFNHTRSNVKLKEYAAVGTPWLASPLTPYLGLGEEQGGRLVPDDRWHAELETMILEVDERRRLARRARIWAEGETIEQHVEGWEQTYGEAIERARAQRPALRNG